MKSAWSTLSYRCRTAISVIGFGIALGKSGDYLETYGIALDSYHSLQIVGLTFITLGVLGVVGASIQNMRIELQPEFKSSCFSISLHFRPPSVGGKKVQRSRERAVDGAWLMYQRV